jgi:hypothetical protein
LVATASNPHLTTPAFVFSLALMVAFANLIYRELCQPRPEVEAA